MNKNIKNYHKIIEDIDSTLGWYEKQIMRIEFQLDENIFNEQRTILSIDTKIANATNNQIFLKKLKFIDVRDLSLREVNYSPIGRLIIQDMKK